MGNGKSIDPCNRASGIRVAGFERLPCGQLLTQFVDFDHPIGAAYERCVGYSKDYHVHDRITLAFPRGSSVIAFTTRAPEDKLVVEESSFLWMPAFVEHRQDTRSVIYDSLAVFPESATISMTLSQLEKCAGRSLSLPRRTVKAKRTKVLDELLHQFFLERVLQKTKPGLLEALAGRILEECMQILTKTKAASAPTTAERGDTATLRALQYIEANLFSPIYAKDLTVAARSSTATLFRRFKRETRLTPFEYIRRRRLEESMQLLKTGDYNVGDVALLVGYEELSSFSKAFKRHFRSAPSKYLGNYRRTEPGTDNADYTRQAASALRP